MFFRPDWREAHHDLRLANGVDSHAADLRKSAISQRIDPLIAMLGILPRRQAISVNFAGHILKRRDLATGIEARIKPLLGHPAVFQRPISGLVQGDNICPAQTEVGPERGAFGIPLPFDDNPYNPPPRPLWIDNKVQSTTIAMPTSAEILDKLLGQVSGNGHKTYHTSYHSMG